MKSGSSLLSEVEWEEDSMTLCSAQWEMKLRKRFGNYYVSGGLNVSVLAFFGGDF